MSQPWQHQHQPQPGQPGYGYPQQPGYGYPQQPGYGYPQPGMGPPAPPPAPYTRRPQPGVAILVSAAAALALALLYGFLTGMVVDFESLIEDAARNGDTEIDVAQLTWLAAAVGALIGLPAAKLAPGQPAAYWTAGALAVVAMLLGETFATAVLASEATDGAKGAFEMFFDNFSDMWEGWTENAHGMTWPLAALAPAAAVLTGYLVGGTTPPQPRTWP
ncbi:hypothetical protein [Streptomyces sp. MP131-18]|uniref:hypothetical protein n=1 Tax=Streptomyces sp. MP131-18 TaxID=1857892 RepID=UPI00097CBE43|nr:hypothetical protein [Streptomyces sp. MP131-18]ONK09821.1 hypothetical protein STBA_05240 [Streptomyces sp. MP131-18]